MIRYASVCDGIGAVHVAWQSLGWECVFTSEIARFPTAVVEHHFGLRNLRGMTEYRRWPEELLADVDLLVGGTPCQSFSVAGYRHSLRDERGNLTLVYVNLFHHINEVRKRHGRPPAIALWENVPGVLSTKDNAFGCFLGGLMRCNQAPEAKGGKWGNAGFLSDQSTRVGWRVLDAKYVALAQRRRRVFVLAVPCEVVERFGEGACPLQILSILGNVHENAPTRSSQPQEASGSRGEFPAGEVSRGEAERQGIDDSGCGEPVVVGSSEVAGTLTARRTEGFRSNGTIIEGLAITPDGPRRFTPRERERLMGFPDDYTAIVNQRGDTAADSPRVTAIGNSMPVPVLRWIGEQIAKAIGGAGTPKCC